MQSVVEYIGDPEKRGLPKEEALSLAAAHQFWGNAVASSSFTASLLPEEE
jgi:hypothetical protein